MRIDSSMPPKSALTERVCKVIDDINNRCHRIYGINMYGNLLISFLKEKIHFLKGFTNEKIQKLIDPIFMLTYTHYPLVNELSKEYKSELYEMFSLFPEDYQDIMRSAKSTYDGSIIYRDCKYVVSLIGGESYWTF